MKKICTAFLMLMAFSAFAEDELLQEEYQEQEMVSVDPAAAAAPAPAALPQAENSLSNDCVKSISRLYRFYFHEIYPNPKNEACRKLSETMGPEETAQMQSVISDLRTNCPVAVVGQITGSFKDLKEERDA